MLTLALLILSIFISYWANGGREARSLVSLPFIKAHIPIVVLNDSGHGVPLFSSNAPFENAIGTLAAGEYYHFSYAGDSGDWLYGTDVFKKVSKRKIAFLIAVYLIKLEYIQKSYTAGIALFVLASIFLVIGRRRYRSELNKALALAEQERKARINSEYLLKQKDQTLLDMAERQTQIKRQSAHLMKKHKAAFQQKERVLRQQFEEDANDLQRKAKQQAKVEITRMQASYDRLNHQFLSLKSDYERLKAEGMVFDIDFDGANYENLLKGRLFEIYFAKSLLADTKFEILSWTSDKGFENGVKVKANGDPDFVIQYNQELVFAVECKFRGGSYVTKEPKSIEWGYTWQVERYAQYQKERQLPVFMCVGFKGSPDKPKHLYLVALDYLRDVSSGRYWLNNKDNQQQLVVDYTDIFDLYIKKTDEFATKALILFQSQLNTAFKRKQ